MKLILLLLSILLISAGAFGQDSTLRKNYTLKVIVEHTGKPPSTRAFLADINDTAVLLMQTRTRFRTLNNEKPTAIPYQQIRAVAVYRTGAAGRGAITGAITGAVLGGLLGAAALQCHDCAHNFSYVSVIGGSVFGAATGSLVGALVGSMARKNFTIGGRKDKFQKMKMSVLERAYGK